MSVAEEAIRKSTGRVNAPLELWGCTKYPIYHEDRVHTYRNCPNNMDQDVVDRTNISIKDYAQYNSEMVSIRSSQGIQYGKGQISSTTTRSMFADRRSQLY